MFAGLGSQLHWSQNKAKTKALSGRLINLVCKADNPFIFILFCRSFALVKYNYPRSLLLGLREKSSGLCLFEWQLFPTTLKILTMFTTSRSVPVHTLDLLSNCHGFRVSKCWAHCFQCYCGQLYCLPFDVI